MEENTKPFDNFELLDCGGFFMTGVTNDYEIEAAAMVLATENELAKKYLTDYPTNIQEANKKIMGCVTGFFEKKILTYIIKAEGVIPMGFIHVFTPDNSTDIKDWLIEYYLNKNFWRQGVMTAAVQNVLAFLQENDVPSIKAVVDLDNVASKRILEKFNFRLCGKNSMRKEIYTRSLKR
jgi:RimJ/RimL family protein N-acetyltransferase